MSFAVEVDHQCGVYAKFYSDIFLEFLVSENAQFE